MRSTNEWNHLPKIRDVTVKQQTYFHITVNQYITKSMEDCISTQTTLAFSNTEIEIW